MDNHFKKTVIRMSFEAVLDQLKCELYKEGFEPGAIIDLQPFPSTQEGVSSRKYKVMSVYNPILYSEMMAFSPYEGIILSCFISIIETCPGQVTLVPYNATQVIAQAIQCATLQKLADEVTRRLERVVQTLEKSQTLNVELVTSWS